MRTGTAAAAALAALFAITLEGQPVSGADRPVDLELVLAVDVSGSMDPDEAQMQRDGYLAALVHPRVIGAIQAGFNRTIAVTYLEWAAFGHNVLVADWGTISDSESAKAYAGRIAELPVTRGMYTSISGAIEFALPLFDGNGYEGMRRVIDISGDGANNAGTFVPIARDIAVAAGVTVNGLPIVNDRLNPFGRPQIPDLDLYYRHCVIGGRGAFIVVAEGFEAFADAIRRKLIFEIADRGPPGGVVTVAAPEPKPRITPFRHAGLRLDGREFGGPVLAGLTRIARREPPPCDIGERLREQRRQMWDDY